MLDSNGVSGLPSRLFPSRTDHKALRSPNSKGGRGAASSTLFPAFKLVVHTGFRKNRSTADMEQVP